MVQIGNIHIGKGETAINPSLDIMEASLLWDFLVGRYKCIEETQIYQNYAHDTDLKQFIKIGITMLENQINELEKQMNQYKIPLPVRPPKSVNTSDGMVFNDDFILKQIFEGCQAYIDYLARISRSMVSNDFLRRIMFDFLKEELAMFDKLCKYAKLKGWLQVPPMYKIH